MLSLNICSLKLWYIGVVYHNQVFTFYYILFWSKVYWCELLAGIFVNKLYGCPVNYAFSRKMCNTASKGSNVCLCAAKIHEIIYRFMNIFICIFEPKFLFPTSVHFVHLVVMYLLQSTDHFMIIDTGLDGLDILFGPALSFCPFSAPSLRAHEIILLLAFTEANDVTKCARRQRGQREGSR